MRPVRAGNGGWPYQDWSGVFYPAELTAGEYLSSHAGRYPAVEVDSTFYRSPGRKLIEAIGQRAISSV